MHGHDPSQIQLGAFGRRWPYMMCECIYDTGVDLYVMFDFEVLVSVAAGSDRGARLWLAASRCLMQSFSTAGGRRLKSKKTLYKYTASMLTCGSLPRRFRRLHRLRITQLKPSRGKQTLWRWYSPKRRLVLPSKAPPLPATADKSVVPALTEYPNQSDSGCTTMQYTSHKANTKTGCISPTVTLRRLHQSNVDLAA